MTASDGEVARLDEPHEARYCYGARLRQHRREARHDRGASLSEHESVVFRLIE